MTKLLIHLGASKCGSSALQLHWANNAEILHSQGVIIPDEKLEIGGKITGHQLWFWENLRPFDDEKAAILHRRLARLAEHAKASGAHTVIVSGENLINPHGFHKVFKGVGRLFDEVEAIVYIRRQDDYIISGWQQWWLKRGLSMEAHLAQEVGKVGNWNANLAPWAEVLGADKIIVRRFMREHLVDGDIVPDFFRSTGLSMDGLAPLRGLINRSFADSIGRMAEQVVDVFDNIHDNRFYDAMIYAIGAKAFKTGKGSSLLTLEQRLRIVDAYRESNEALRARYLPSLPADEPLFPAPTEKDVITLTPEQARQEEHELLIRAVYGLAQRQLGVNARLDKLERS